MVYALFQVLEDFPFTIPNSIYQDPLLISNYLYTHLYPSVAAEGHLLPCLPNPSPTLLRRRILSQVPAVRTVTQLLAAKPLSRPPAVQLQDQDQQEQMNLERPPGQGDHLQKTKTSMDPLRLH